MNIKIASTLTQLIMPKRLLIIVFSFFCMLSFGQNDTIWPVKKNRSLGSYTISSPHGNEIVNVSIERNIFKKSKDYFWNETDVSIILTNNNGAVLYRKNYPGGPGGEMDISVDSIYLEGIGSKLLVNFVFVPSCGSCGNDVQILGFDEYGYIVTYTDIIRVYETLDSNSYFRVRWVKDKNDLILTSENCADYLRCKSYLEFANFTGFCGFNTLEYVPIEKNGIYEGPFREKVNFDKIPLELKYYTIDKLYEFETDSALVLYSKPDILSHTNTINLKKGMAVKFFEGLNLNDKVWIHLRIAGNEGYILWDDISKLGFPACG